LPSSSQYSRFSAEISGSFTDKKSSQSFVPHSFYHR
jgi:hypothetical protein